VDIPLNQSRGIVHMQVRFIASACSLALFPLLANAFDSTQLSGLWAESTQNRYACTSTTRYQHFELALDGKTLAITFEPHAHAGKAKAEERLTLTVIRAEEHALTVRFDGHDAPGDSLAGDWQMSFLGPGVYRWHLVSAHETLQPAPIAVRCAQ
jgi:hypothetical protein